MNERLDLLLCFASMPLLPILIWLGTHWMGV